MPQWSTIAGGSNEQTISANLELFVGSARLQVITASAGSLEVRLPPVKSSGETHYPNGESFMILNVGAVNSFDVKDYSGNAIQGGITLTQDKVAICYVLDDSTTDGTWAVILADTGAGSALEVALGQVYGPDGSDVEVWQYNHQLPFDRWTQQANDVPDAIDPGGDDEQSFAAGTSVGYLLQNPAIGAPRFDKYDPPTWTTGLNTAGFSARHNSPFLGAAYRASGAQGWFFGLWGSGGGTDDDLEVWTYDTGGDSWAQQSDVSDSISGEGWVENNDDADTAYIFATTGEWRYDYSSTTLTALAPYSRLAAVRFGGFHIPDTDDFYDFLGRVAATPLSNSSEVWQYDTSADVWNIKQAFPASLDRVNQIYCWSSGGRGFIYGGQKEDSSTTDAVRHYDAASDTWTAGEDHPSLSALGYPHLSQGLI